MKNKLTSFHNKLNNTCLYYPEGYEITLHSIGKKNSNYTAKGQYLIFHKNKGNKREKTKTNCLLIDETNKTSYSYVTPEKYLKFKPFEEKSISLPSPALVEIENLNTYHNLHYNYWIDTQEPIDLINKTERFFSNAKPVYFFDDEKESALKHNLFTNFLNNLLSLNNLEIDLKFKNPQEYFDYKNKQQGLFFIGPYWDINGVEDKDSFSTKIITQLEKHKKLFKINNITEQFTNFFEVALKYGNDDFILKALERSHREYFSSSFFTDLLKANKYHIVEKFIEQDKSNIGAWIDVSSVDELKRVSKHFNIGVNYLLNSKDEEILNYVLEHFYNDDDDISSYVFESILANQLKNQNYNFLFNFIKKSQKFQKYINNLNIYQYIENYGNFQGYNNEKPKTDKELIKAYDFLNNKTDIKKNYQQHYFTSFYKNNYLTFVNYLLKNSSISNSDKISFFSYLEDIEYHEEKRQDIKKKTYQQTILDNLQPFNLSEEKESDIFKYNLTYDNAKSVFAKIKKEQLSTAVKQNKPLIYSLISNNNSFLSLYLEENNTKVDNSTKYPINIQIYKDSKEMFFNSLSIELSPLEYFFAQQPLNFQESNNNLQKIMAKSKKEDFNNDFLIILALNKLIFEKEDLKENNFFTILNPDQNVNLCKINNSNFAHIFAKLMTSINNKTSESTKKAYDMMLKTITVEQLQEKDSYEQTPLDILNASEKNDSKYVIETKLYFETLILSNTFKENTKQKSLKI